jgi:glycosyltransferase involved in cell wall biosynthesis
MKIYLLVYRFGHHYSVSGYNRLAEFLPCTTVAIPGPVGTILKNIATPKYRERLVAETGLSGYFPECRWLEWSTGLLSKIPSNSIFHYIYPENSYYYTASYYKSSRAKVVATFHQPVIESTQFILKTDAIRRLDGVILLSESQRDFFSPHLGDDRIFVVPHGIDLNYFTPGRGISEKNNIVAVGNWLRDYKTLSAALRILQEKRPRLTCNIVTQDNNKGHFTGLTNVVFHSGISDLDLLRLYQQAGLAVLSLTGTAANNALLEALACGLPIVATDLPAIREYTTPEGARYVRHSDPDHLAQTIIDTIDDGRGRGLMSRANRSRAERYSWETVARQTMDVYQRIKAL